MINIEIGGVQYPAKIYGSERDTSWGGRKSKTIFLEMDYQTASSLFVDGLQWASVRQDEPYANNDGEIVIPEPVRIDNSEYCVAGAITDHRNGTVSVKMGKITAEEALAELMEVLSV